MTTPVTTTAKYLAPGVFDAGSRAHFSVAADLRTASALKAFVESIAGVCNVIELGVPSDTAMRFAVENNGVTAAQLSTASGATVTAFTY